MLGVKVVEGAIGEEELQAATVGLREQGGGGELGAKGQREFFEDRDYWTQVDHFGLELLVAAH